jgi:hypothetical protein
VIHAWFTTSACASGDRSDIVTFPSSRFAHCHLLPPINRSNTYRSLRHKRGPRTCMAAINKMRSLSRHQCSLNLCRAQDEIMQPGRVEMCVSPPTRSVNHTETLKQCNRIFVSSFFRRPCADLPPVTLVRNPDVSASTVHYFSAASLL